MFSEHSIEKAKKIENFTKDLEVARQSILEAHSKQKTYGEIISLNDSISPLSKAFEKYIKTGIKGIISRSTPLLKEAKKAIDNNKKDPHFTGKESIEDIINSAKTISDLKTKSKIVASEINKVEKILKPLEKIRDFNKKPLRRGHDSILTSNNGLSTNTRVYSIINNICNVITVDIKAAKERFDKVYKEKLNELNQAGKPK